MVAQYNAAQNSAQPNQRRNSIYDYNGTPATKMNSSISGQLVLRSLAIHELPNGTIAAVNGNAVTTMSDGQVQTINCTQGYQSIDPAMLKAAIERRLGSYRITVDCGNLWGLQGGRAIQLDPADAAAFGVDKAYVRHTVTADENEVGKQIDGVIFVSSSAIIRSGVDASSMANDPKLQFSDASEKIFDVYPIAEGLERAKNLADAECNMQVTDRFGAQLVIRKFPRGNQRQQVRDQKASTNQYPDVIMGRPAASQVDMVASPFGLRPAQPETTPVSTPAPFGRLPYTF